MRSVHTDGYNAVLEALTAARQRAGLSQQELAARLRRPQSFVSKYENGERRIDVAEFILLMRVLGEDPGAAFAEILAASPFVKNARPKRSR